MCCLGQKVYRGRELVSRNGRVQRGTRKEMKNIFWGLVRVFDAFFITVGAEENHWRFSDRPLIHAGNFFPTNSPIESDHIGVCVPWNSEARFGINFNKFRFAKKIFSEFKHILGFKFIVQQTCSKSNCATFSSFLYFQKNAPSEISRSG